LLQEAPSEDYCITFFKKDKVNTLDEIEKIFNDPTHKNDLFFYLPDKVPFKLFPRPLLFTVKYKNI
jgi:hypothetical protein